MKTIYLLNALKDFLSILIFIEAKEQPYPSATRFLKSVTLSYQTLVLKMNKVMTEEEEGVDSHYLQCRFEIDHENAVSLILIYCSNEDHEQELKEIILQQAPTRFISESNEQMNSYSNEVIQYLTMADEIAKAGYLCSVGDDYRPGYFSEIIVEDEQIVLKQINRMNSRSLDHKNNYHMRDLEFYIPLTSKEPKRFFGDEQIGKMLIRFSDNSSNNNKRCGDKIRVKIEEERVKFEEKK